MLRRAWECWKLAAPSARAVPRLVGRCGGGDLTGWKRERQTEEQQPLHGSARSVTGSERREDSMKKRDFSDFDSNLTHARNPPPVMSSAGLRARATSHHFTPFSPSICRFLALHSVFYYAPNAKARGNAVSTSVPDLQNKI